MQAIITSKKLVNHYFYQITTQNKPSQRGLGAFLHGFFGGKANKESFST